jgi:glycosyltransferase involved in cell wall biosynthesis
VYILSSVLVVTERYWPDGSGGELATHLILDILRKRFDVTVVTGTKNSSKLPSVRYVYEPLLSKREKLTLWLNILRLIQTQRFQKLLRESDTVYIPRFAFPVIPCAKRLGKKVVVHLHGYIPISYTATVLAPYEEHKHRITLDNIKLECMRSLKHCLGVNLLWWLPKLARKQISQADKIICVSKRQAKIIADQAPELRDKIEVVYNPLPLEIINITPRKELNNIPTFLYVGGDSYVKGFHILLQALSKIGKQEVRARFILANKYSTRSLEALRRLSYKYGNLDIQVLGRMEYEKLKELHMNAWALLFPSISEETFGYAVVEAATLSTIPIASRVGGVTELLNDTIAQQFMVSPSSVNDLVKKISMILSLNTDEVKVLGFKLRNEILQKLDLNKIERRIIEVFEEGY